MTRKDPLLDPPKSRRRRRYLFIPLIAAMVALLTLAFTVPQPDLFEAIARNEAR